MSGKRHHVVSQGYQRLFATPTGVRLVDKERMTAKVVGTRGAFVRQHFSSYIREGEWSTELEDEWALRESQALPHLRRLNAGDRDEEARDATKTIAALHYARSYTFEEMFNRISDQIADERSKILDDGELRDRFREQMGRDPELGELEQSFQEAWDARRADRTLLVQQMAEGYNKTLTILAPHYVQFVWPKNPKADQFVFGDLPLVHWSSKGLSARGGVALGDAEKVFLPLGPTLACFFCTSQVPDGAIDRPMLHFLNLQSWAAATRLVGAHPDTNVKRALTKWNLTVE